MFEVVFLSGVRAGAVVLVSGTMLAGRSPDCHIEVPDPNASRVHTRLEWDGAVLTAIDNGSSNGTWVNEERIDRVQMQHGDILRMGETRMRIQQRSRRKSGGDPSSVFNLREAASDLSNSLSMSLSDASFAGSLSTEALRARLDAMMWVSETLASITDPSELFQPILETLFKVFPQADRGFLLLGESPDQLEPKAMRTRAAGATQGLTVSASLCRAALERRAVVVYAEDEEADFDQGMSLVNLQIRSAMAVPLIVADEVLGLTVIDTPDRTKPFNEDDMGLAAAVCRQGAVALKNALLLAQVEKETKTRANLMRFLPKPVVDQAVAGEIDLALGGSTCRGTVFFCDIIGFTRMSESLHPQSVVTMMNELFNTICPLIEQEGGAIDKFMGDCVMALWGIPFDSGRSSLQAVAAGLEIQTALATFNHGREGDSDAPLVRMGIGMSYGQLVAGNVGSLDRVEYTVLGNTVNTASRIQQLASGEQVLVGAELFDPIASHCYAVRMPAIHVKNKAEPVAVYAIRGVRMSGDEVMLHLPIRIAGNHAWLTRRLADGTFVCLHGEDQGPDGQRVETAVVELPATDLGTVEALSLLPRQDGDGGLRRSLVSLPDPTLSGLLGDEPMVCPLEWDAMQRSQ